MFHFFELILWPLYNLHHCSPFCLLSNQDLFVLLDKDRDLSRYRVQSPHISNDLLKVCQFMTSSEFTSPLLHSTTMPNLNTNRSLFFNPVSGATFSGCVHGKASLVGQWRLRWTISLTSSWEWMLRKQTKSFLSKFSSQCHPHHPLQKFKRYFFNLQEANTHLKC